MAGERNGRWGKAIQVPGLAALNKAGNARVTSVSCGSAGNCAAGGFYAFGYADDNDYDQGFTATERHGSWSKAIQVPGLATLNKDKNAQVRSVSCAPVGNCAAGCRTGTTEPRISPTPALRPVPRSTDSPAQRGRPTVRSRLPATFTLRNHITDRQTHAVGDSPRACGSVGVNRRLASRSALTTRELMLCASAALGWSRGSILCWLAACSGGVVALALRGGSHDFVAAWPWAPGLGLRC